MNALIPHQRLQRLVLKEFATSVSHLPEDKERVQWAVTLQPTSVRLNIGRIEAFTIFRDRVRVLISESKMNLQTVTVRHKTINERSFSL